MFWGFSCWTSKTRHLKASPWITAMGADWTVNHQMYCSPVGRINIGNARFWKPAVCWNLTFLCVAALGFFRLEHFVYLVWKVSLNHPLVSLTNVEILERLELRWSAQQTSRLWLHHRRGHPPPDVKVRWRMWCNTCNTIGHVNTHKCEPISSLRKRWLPTFYPGDWTVVWLWKMLYRWSHFVRSKTVLQTGSRHFCISTTSDKWFSKLFVLFEQRSWSNFVTTESQLSPSYINYVELKTP